MFHQYGAPADPKLHAASLAEVKRGQMMMGGGAVLAVLGIILPGRLWTTAGVGGGMVLWTMGMKQQMTAGVEAKIADEGLTGILARCAARCIANPNL